MLLESERLDPGCGDALSIAAFTSVLMAHGIYDTDYEAFHQVTVDKVKEEMASRLKRNQSIHGGLTAEED